MSQKNSGFSLIELTVVVIIGGLLLTAFADILLTSQKQAKIKVTRDRIEVVDEALRNYSLINFRLPCAARRNEPADTTNYAVEVPNCSSAATPGTVRANTAAGLYPAAGQMIRIGSVPTRTLNLPDNYGYDAWGGRLVYAVSEAATQQTTFDMNAPNTIGVVDRNDNSVISPDRSLAYLVLSHGADKEGAFNISGNLIIACNAGELDGENCDDDIAFRTTAIASDGTSAANFDDIVSYRGNVRISEVPSGAIMAFRSGSCPPGWQDAIDLRGRFVVGTGMYNQPAPPPTNGLASTYSGQNFVLGSAGGSATTRGTNGSTAEFMTLPPYIALRYCEKI